RTGPPLTGTPAGATSTAARGRSSQRSVAVRPTGRSTSHRATSEKVGQPRRKRPVALSLWDDLTNTAGLAVSIVAGLVYSASVGRARNWTRGKAERLARRRRLPHYVLPNGEIRFRLAEVLPLVRHVRPQDEEGAGRG